ncbi:MAG TPA: glutaredoxin domain-containing protein [archaeon]|nr:glutaredoxin domain-containing protein [archaeon]
MGKVTIYTTPTCTYCKLAKAYFKENNVEYKEINVAADQSKAQEMFEKSGQLGVPVLEINGKIIVGFDKPALKEALGL